MKFKTLFFLTGLTAIAFSLVIADTQQPNKPIVPKEKIMLWNGKDFTGWKLFLPDENADVNTVWSIQNDVIHCEGVPMGYMRTEADYADYYLHVEWRWPGETGNSGVLLHASLPDKVWPKCIECQLWATHAGDTVAMEGTTWKEYARKSKRIEHNIIVSKLKECSEKEPGRWNTYEIICKDDWMVVLVNGVLQNVVSGASVTSGQIGLQSEGAPIEFRNIYLEPLDYDPKP
jgi:hypothetical protein